MPTPYEVAVEIGSTALVAATLAVIAALGWLPWAAVIAAVPAVSVPFIFGVVRVRWRLRNREAQLGACVQALGLQCSPGQVPAPAGESFFLERGNMVPLADSLWGDWGRLPVGCAEYRSPLTGAAGAALFFFSAVHSDLGVTVPYVEISGKRRRGRRKSILGVRDVELYPEPFGCQFRVMSQDEQFARTLIDADMMAWLLSAGPKLRFEMGGHRLVVSGSGTAPLDPAGLRLLLDAAAGFFAHIPRAVLVGYAAESW